MEVKNERVCYHSIEMPRGLVVLGDSVQRLNALYGQGMTISAQSVLLFDEALSIALKGQTHHAKRTEALRQFGKSFQKRLEINLRPSWSLTTMSDLK